jgi:hypothetical protein
MDLKSFGTNNSKINFGYRVYIDSGASKQQNGSLKVSIQSDKGNELLSTSQLTNLNDQMVCPGGFKKSDDYTRCLAERTRHFIELAKKNPDFDELEGKDKKLSGVVINVPCQVVNNKVSIITNLKLPDGQSLTNVDFGNIEKALKKDVEVSDDFKFIATNDLPGAAAGVAKLLNEKNLLKEGFYGAVCMTGGGCGVADIKVKNNTLEIEASESGHNQALNSNLSIEKDGASSPALISNFAKSLGYDNKDILALSSTGKAKLVFKHHLKVEKNSQDLEVLLKTGLFKQLEDAEDGKAVLKLKGVGKKEQAKACQKAISKYIDSIAQLAAPKVNEGLNLLVLTGPLAGRVKEFVDEKPTEFESKNLATLIQEKTASYLDDSGASMAKTYNFKVACDNDFAISDNTIGGKVLLAGTSIDSQNRGNWINIPVEALN